MPRIFICDIEVGEDAIDVHRHVNNQEYLRWLQEAAIGHSAAQGWPLARYLESGASWYVRSHTIEYLRPARLGERLRVATWVGEMDERSSLRHTLFWRAGQIVARGQTRWTYIRLRDGRPLPIPPAVREAYELVGDEAEVMAALAAGEA